MDLFKRMQNLDSMDQDILLAAWKEFIDKGYYRANVDSIAAALKIGKGSIYRHFGNKALLFAAVLFHHFQKTIKDIKEILDLMDNDPSSALNIFCDRIIDSVRQGYLLTQTFSLEEMRIFKREMKSQMDFKAIKEAMVTLYQTMFDVLQKILIAGQRKKIFSKQSSSRITAEIVLRILLAVGGLTTCPTHKTPGQLQTQFKIPDLKKFIFRSLYYAKK